MTMELSPQTSMSSNSPEFEFSKLSHPQPNLLSADQLFSGGFLLPLHNLNISNETTPAPEKEPLPGPVLFQESPRPSSTFPSPASSKRWRQIFRKTGKKSSLDFDKDVAGGKDRKKINAAVGVSVASAELNINLWPFSRSRSAGTGGGRPRTAAAAATVRKVSSAPCSRSNSTGESKSRKPPASTVTGVHLGRTSPILKFRRGGRRSTPQNVSSPKAAPGGTKTKVLNLNVPMCIGYRQNSSCSREENSPIDAAVAAATDAVTEGAAVGGEELRRSNLLSIRNLFTKNVY